MHSVWFLLFDRFQLLDVCGPLQVFATANDELVAAGRAPFYRASLRAPGAGTAQSSSGVALASERLPGRLARTVDTIVVPGGPGAWHPGGAPPAPATHAVVEWLMRNAPRAGRVASVCTGAFLLARSGHLDGRTAVTHWAACESLRKAHPSVQVQGDAIYFRDGPFWTSAGVTAGIDMALGMVECDVGRDIAMSVAKKLVVFYKRPGGQSQFSSQLLEQTAGDERIARLHAWIGDHLRDSLHVSRLAERLSMTPRTFARFYRAATGVTPARAVEQIRIERACRLIESQRQSLKAIAQQCGFSSEEVLRRTFVRHLQVSPTEYRQRFSAAEEVAASARTLIRAGQDGRPPDARGRSAKARERAAPRLGDGRDASR